MGQVISLLETGDAHAHDRASHQQHLYNNRHQPWAQQEYQHNYRQDYYSADRLGGGPIGTGYAIPGPAVGNGQVTINVPHDRRSTNCATATAAGAGAGFVGGAAGGSALGNAYCPQIPSPVGQAACRAGSSMLGGAAGAYEGGMKGYNSPFCGGSK